MDDEDALSRPDAAASRAQTVDDAVSGCDAARTGGRAAGAGSLPGDVPPGAVPERQPGAYRWIFATTVAFLSVAAILRSLLAFAGEQRIFVLSLLVAWLVLVLAGSFAARAWPPSFIGYLVAQTVLILLLLTQSDSSDYFAVLLAVPTMQAMERWRPRAMVMLIGLFALLTGLALIRDYGPTATLALVAIYAAGNVFFAAYTAAARRAREARTLNEALVADLQETNRCLADHARQAEQLGAARERQRLARDLHDSVTQTLFSMTLTAQSALLLLRQESGEVAVQLDQIDRLAHGALQEMSMLSDQPLPATGVLLLEALEQHCVERRLRDGLTVTLEVDGGEPLPAENEQALQRIVQEGLNNVVKHAGVEDAVVRLRLRRPFRLEVEDRGRGFDISRAGGAGLGLTGMNERAAEIGWSLTVTSTPGNGTRVVAEEAGDAGNQAAGRCGRGRRQRRRVARRGRT